MPWGIGGSLLRLDLPATKRRFPREVKMALVSAPGALREPLQWFEIQSLKHILVSRGEPIETDRGIRCATSPAPLPRPQKSR
jgi:hypothetical protein